VPDIPGIAFQVLGPVSDANIEVDVIVQNVAADGNTDITFTVKRQDCHRTEELLRAVAQRIGAREVSVDSRIAKVSLVGVGMRSHAGIASKMFKTLAEESINIQIITTSEIKISVVIDEKYLELAVRALHSAFGLGESTISAD
jgi:aspartate kinase